MGQGDTKIVDLGSERGVVVARSKVSKHTLGLGDEIQIGVFSIVIPGIGEQPAPGKEELPSAKEKLRARTNQEALGLSSSDVRRGGQR